MDYTVKKHKPPLQLILIMVVVLGYTSANAQSFFEKAEDSFAKRYENPDGIYARKLYVNKAIRNYKKSKKTPETIAAMLRAYEFKASYTKQSKIVKKGIYKKAVAIGKKGMHDYPDNTAIKYFYMTNLGRWGQAISIVKASRKGIVEEIRTLNKEIIQVDSTFDEAGALRILGAMHLKIPNIPFLISWPSEEQGLTLLGAAYRLAPGNVGNVVLYAEALIENNKRGKAQILLKDAISREPRKNRLLEDQKKIEEAKQLYREVFD